MSHPTHTATTLSQINALDGYINSQTTVFINGHNLDISAVVAVSRHGIIPQLVTKDEVKSRISRAAEIVQEALEKEGGSLYGVTTGVGASAFMRTTDVDELQRALVNKNLNGIIPSLTLSSKISRLNLILPEEFMRGTVMVRLNTLMRGHSGVRWCVIEKMYTLLKEDVVPCAPKNNTVRFEGDLGTLAYIAGTLLGREDVLVWHGKNEERRIKAASEVLNEIGMNSLVFGPKEAIAILNGTAASSSAAAQVLYDANVLLLATQCMSVLTMEALRANLEPFKPFPHVVARPHPGQIEVADNILRMANGSKFIFDEYPEGDPEFKLRQDRYHIRHLNISLVIYYYSCVPQWVGPFAENLVQATRQIEIELNSTTDNPIIDPNGTYPTNVYHAGNFQALSVSDAMDKVRHAMQGVGKLLYSQHTELLNPLLNRGLPADCAAGEPNIDYGLKSSDLACAAYLSELGFLAGSFLPHVHSTEHHNQSINSMALASARHAQSSIELLQQLIATHLYTLCQALDLREMNSQYLSKLRNLFSSELKALQRNGDATDIVALEETLFTVLRVRFSQTASLTSDQRFQAMFSSLLYPFSKTAVRTPALEFLDQCDWLDSLALKAKDLFLKNRLNYITSGGSAYESLGRAGKVIYSFVRHDLGVSMRKGLQGMDQREIGTGISQIFEAISCGTMDLIWKQALLGEDRDPVDICLPSKLNGISHD
ncbi:L-Aspartase-like protein [Hysterangium stoloniferum]|nr:L-Aspartase-like protein [Hysterangium stoloniferum]